MLDPLTILTPFLLLGVVWLLKFVGCQAIAAIDYVPRSTLAVFPEKAELGPGESMQFIVLSDGAATQNVDWSANAPGGLFKAPDPFVPGSSMATVTATAKNSTASVSAVVILKSVTVTVTP